MAAPAIRPAGAADAEAVRRLVRAAYAHYVERIGREPAPMQDDHAGQIAAGQTWVLEDAAGLAGVLVLERAEPGVLLLENVAVDARARGLGYGRALLDFAEAEARRLACPELRLYTHVLMTENQALYRQRGFVETQRVREQGLDRVYMAKAIA